MNVLNECFDNYVNILCEKHKIEKDLIVEYIKKQKWKYNLKKETSFEDIYKDQYGNKYYLLNNNLGVKIIE